VTRWCCRLSSFESIGGLVDCGRRVAVEGAAVIAGCCCMFSSFQSMCGLIDCAQGAAVAGAACSSQCEWHIAVAVLQ
jgi:hypothetical protein